MASLGCRKPTNNKSGSSGWPGTSTPPSRRTGPGRLSRVVLGLLLGTTPQVCSGLVWTPVCQTRWPSLQLDPPHPLACSPEFPTNTRTCFWCGEDRVLASILRINPRPVFVNPQCIHGPVPLAPSQAGIPIRPCQTPNPRRLKTPCLSTSSGSANVLPVPRLPVAPTPLSNPRWLNHSTAMPPPQPQPPTPHGPPRLTPSASSPSAPPDTSASWALGPARAA